MKRIIILLITIFTLNVANAQWVQTSLDSVEVKSIAITGGNIFVGISHYLDSNSQNTTDNMYLSTNNGTSWTAVNNGLPLIYDGYIYAIVINGNNIYAGISGGVYLSTNNGNSWTAMNNGLPLDANILNLAINNDTIIAISNNSSVFLSTNNGNSWSAVNNGFPSNTNIISLAINWNTIFLGTEQGIVYVSSYNGNSWTALNNGLPTDNYFTSLASNGNNIYASSWSHGVFLSTDNGNSWTAINSGLTVPFVYCLVIKDSIILAGTWDSGGVFISTDNGSNWTALGLTSDNITSLAIGEDFIFAGTLNSGVWKYPFNNIIGIKENKINNNVYIYPNPAKENLTIETNSNTEQRLEIINLMGQTVYTNIFNKKATINTSAFQSGVYIIKLYTDKETVVRKFVKE